MKDEQTMEHWIPVQPDHYDEPHEVGLKAEVDAFFSPYDVPDGIRGTYDQRRKRLVIEFRYLVDEDYRTRRAERGPVRVRLGKHSDRIVGFEIDSKRLQSSKGSSHGGSLAAGDAHLAPDDAYRAAVLNAIQTVKGWRSANRRENYQVAQKVVGDFWIDLVHYLTASPKG